MLRRSADGGRFHGTGHPRLRRSGTVHARVRWGELTENEVVRRRLYSLYLILIMIMIIETNYRGHTDTKQYDWARERMQELLALFGRSH